MISQATGQAVLTAGIAVVLVAIAGLFGAWYRRHPNRSRANPRRVRMPRFMAWVGVGLVLLGLVFGATTAVADPEDVVPLRVFTVAAIIGGLLFIVLYVRWFVEMREDHMVVRGIVGSERVIWFRDIVNYRFSGTPSAPTVTIRSLDGTRFSANYRTFDLSPLLQAIEYHRVVGEWPPSRGLVPPVEGPGW